MRLEIFNIYQQYKNFVFRRPFLKKTYKPKYYQFKLLSRIIKDNKYTKFGIDYHFNKIKKIEDFQKKIPILKYDDISKYINDSKFGMKHSIISNDIVYFAMSSGTTNEPKFIPHTQNYILLRKEAWEVWINSLFWQRPKTFSFFGGILTFTAKPYDDITDGGIKYGSVSGQIHDLQPSFVKFLYGVPNEVLLIDDFKLKYYLSILFSIRKDLRLIVTPNPSTLIVFAKKFDKYYHQIINDLKTNNIEMLNDANIDEKLKLKLLKLFQKKKRLNYNLSLKLKKIKNNFGSVLPKYFFSNLQTIACWKSGSMSVYLDKLPYYYGDNVLIRDIGYMASEGRFSIPVSDYEHGAGVLDIENNFYEFVDVDSYDDGKNYHIKLAHDLKKGKKYYIIITNENGLYRYFIDDIILVKDFYNNTPVIEFIQKGKYVSSITGEKITEWEVISALSEASNISVYKYHTFFVVPNVDKEKVYYKYFIEFDKSISNEEIKRMEILLDNNLKKFNIEYMEKRNSQRISKIKIEKLKHNSISILKKEFSKGKNNDTQVKVPKLIVLENDKEILKRLKFIS